MVAIIGESGNGNGDGKKPEIKHIFQAVETPDGGVAINVGNNVSIGNILLAQQILTIEIQRMIITMQQKSHPLVKPVGPNVDSFINNLRKQK